MIKLSVLMAFFFSLCLTQISLAAAEIKSPVVASIMQSAKASDNDLSSQVVKDSEVSAINPDIKGFRTLQEKNKIILLVSIMIATPVFLFLVLYSINKTEDHVADHVVNGSELVLVIQATTFIVIAAPTSEQLTAAIGVLGAIAGYLFGTSNRSRQSREALQK